MAEITELQKFRDIPITTSPGTDNYRTLHQILRSLEEGQFFDAALLVDAMLRDDRIFGVLSTRINGLLGTPVTFCKGSDTAAADRALELSEGTEAVRGFYGKAFTPSVLGDLLLWGRMIGVAVAEIVWRTEDGVTYPSLNVWHPQFITWDWGTRSYWINTANGREELPRPETPDSKWLVFTPSGYQYGWLRGLVRPLAKLYLGRGWSYRDWLRYSEKHGMPLDVLYVPATAPTQEADQLFKKVSRRNSETAIKLPRAEGGEGTSYDLKMLEATARSWDCFNALLDKLNTDIAVCVLGQNLTTEVQGGSLAAANVSNNVRSDYRRADAEALSSAIYQQVMIPWAVHNFGDPSAAPIPEFDLEPAEDLVKDAQTLGAVANALKVFGESGAPVDMVAVFEEYGIPLAEISAPPVAPPPPAGAPSSPPPIAGAPPPAAASEVLAEPDKPAAAELGAKKAKTKRYEDRLMANAKRASAAALKPSVDLIMEAVHSAKDYEDLKKKLLKAYDGTDVKVMQRTLERAIIMAKLAGRYDVTKAI